MRYAYALLGLAFIILIGAGIFLMPSEELKQEETFISDNNEEVTMLTLSSLVFKHNSTIPLKYTCDGDDVNPPLEISGVPENAKSLALIMDDPDVPAQVNPAQMWDHWVVFNIPPDTSAIEEGKEPEGAGGNNSWGRVGYGGPCPPTQYQPTEHRYFFKLYALDAELDLPAGAAKAEVERAMEGHVLEQTEFVGRYDRAR